MEKRWYLDNLDFIKELTEDQRTFFYLLLLITIEKILTNFFSARRE